MNTLRCLDSQPDLLIPRFYFSYNDVSKSFNYHIPLSDVTDAQPLTEPPGDLTTKRSGVKLSQSLRSYAHKNKAGEITVSDDGEFVTAALKLNSLPPYDEVDPAITSYVDSVNAANKTRLPILKDKHELFQKIVGLSELQYLFGVHMSDYDESLPPAPARFSMYHDYNHFSPVTIVRLEFDIALNSIRNEHDIHSLSDRAKNYVKKYDPETTNKSLRFSPIDAMEIGRYGIIDDGMDFAYGYRGSGIDDYRDMSDCIEFRILSGDSYKASADNSGVEYEDIFSMLGVGMINRLALDRVAPGLIE